MTDGKFPPMDDQSVNERSVQVTTSPVTSACKAAEPPSIGKKHEKGGKYMLKKLKKLSMDEVATAKELLNMYDVDHDGVISKEELMAIIVDLRSAKVGYNKVSKIACALCLFTALLATSLFGTSFAAAFLAKDTHVQKSMLVGDDDTLIKTGSAEFQQGLFDLPKLDQSALAGLKRLDVVIDGRGSAVFDDDVVDASFHISSWIRSSKHDTLVMYTPSGATIKVSSDNATATVDIGGETLLPVYPDRASIVGFGSTPDGLLTPDESGLRALSSDPSTEGATHLRRSLATFVGTSGAVVQSCPLQNRLLIAGDVFLCTGIGSPVVKQSCTKDNLKEGLDKYTKCSKWAAEPYNGCNNAVETVGDTGVTYQAFMLEFCKCSCRSATKTYEQGVNQGGGDDAVISTMSPPSSPPPEKKEAPPPCEKNKPPKDKWYKCAERAAKECTNDKKFLSSGESHAFWMQKNCKCSCEPYV